MKQSQKYYAVRVGRSVGIFDNWFECEKNVKGYRRAEFKSFKFQSDAKRWLHYKKDNQCTLDKWLVIIK